MSTSRPRGGKTDGGDGGCEALDLAFFGGPVLESWEQVFCVQLVELDHCGMKGGQPGKQLREGQPPPCARSVAVWVRTLWFYCEDEFVDPVCPVDPFRRERTVAV